MDNFRLAGIQTLASEIPIQSVLTNEATNPMGSRPLTKLSGKDRIKKLN